jgi:hypothetical protein
MRIRFRLKKRTASHRYTNADGEMVVMQPGDIIECEPDKLKYFMDKFEQLDPDPPLPVPVVGLTMERASEEPNQWNVINEATGKRINDIPLGLRDAQALVREKKAMMQEEDATEEE